METETIEATATTTAQATGKAQPAGPAPSEAFPWIIEAPLGRGGQGTSWRARHRDTGQVVALKRFKLREATDWKAFDLFEREARTLEALSHPGIPRFYSQGGDRERGELWLAMELVEGRPLTPDRPWRQSELEDVARQVLAVLDYLHGLTPPVIHRDVKPGNLVLRPDGRVMVIDFGSVRTALAAEGGSTLVGTFGYLAPEQLHGAATAATDLYSLGMTLAALAAGQEATALPRSGLALDCAKIFPDGRLRALVAAMTAPDPAARPASARAALDILQASPEVTREPVFTATGSAQPALEPDEPSPEPERRPRGLFATLVSLVIWLVFASVGLVLKLVEHIVTRAQSHELQRRLSDERKVTERERKRSETLAARQARDRERLAKTRERFTRIADRFDPTAGPPRRGGRRR